MHEVKVVVKMTHAIERTSPIGDDFVGRCWQCGQEGLSAFDATKECPNTNEITHIESLLRAIDGPTEPKLPPEATDER